jgi:phosphotransferase system enzyme I (PtsI)
VVASRLLTGLGASSGVAQGEVFLVDRRKRRYPTRHIDEEGVSAELARLDAAVDVAARSLEQLRAKVVASGYEEHSAILDAHLLMLRDPMLIGGARRAIEEERRCAEWAVRSTVKDIKAAFDKLGDSYFRERRSDVDFVGERLLSAMGSEESALTEVPDDAIVVTHTLSPADTLRLMRRRLRGFVTETGGATGHTAILARALRIPAVVGCSGVLEHAGHGDDIVLDGTSGEVVLDPDAGTSQRFRGRARASEKLEQAFLEEVGEPAVSADGHPLPLLANIELVDEVGPALKNGASGVGLYRTEFLFLSDGAIPSASDHFHDTARLLDELDPDMPAHVRVFDLGSDKLAQQLSLPAEDNPALGLRGVRLGLEHPELLRAQLSGMVRAMSARRRGSILLPMICCVEELEQVRAVLNEEMDALEADGVDVWREIPLGVMIELPAAVWVADQLAERCDYFSVGSNDLVQYSLAVDRGNTMVSHLYQPLHVGHLRALEHVVKAGRAAGIPVSLCGEMAADPVYLPVLLGLGFDAISMPAVALPRARWVLRRMDRSEAERCVTSCLGSGGARDVEELCRALLAERVPELAV